MTAGRAHSPIGASQMYRWAACPGSVRLCATAPGRSSLYADEGTLAHAVAAHCLLREEDPRRIRRFDGKDLPEDMGEAVHSYVDLVRRDRAAGYELRVEVPFDLAKLHPGLYGTSDAVLWHPLLRRLKVYDYKHGAGVPVEVKDNPQLWYYALGALSGTKLPALQVELVIVQPRCTHADGPVRSQIVEPLALLEFRADLVDYAKKTEAPDAPLVTGDHCRWCSAAALCPALREKAQQAAKMEFSTAIAATTGLKGEVLVYDPEELAKALALAELAENWASSVREFAYAEAMRGHVPPRHKLVAKRATRRWLSEEQAVAAMTLLDLPEEQTHERSLRSPAQVKDLVDKATFRTLEQVIVKHSSGYALVHESDRRPAVTLDAASEFAAVPAVPAPGGAITKEVSR